MSLAKLGCTQFEANGWFNLALALNCLNQYLDALSAYKSACTLYQQMEMLNHVEECEKVIEDVTLAQAIEEDALREAGYGRNYD